MSSDPSSPGAARATSAPHAGDLFACAQRLAALLRSAAPGDVNVEQKARELEELSRLEETELREGVELLLVHLLKWQMQPWKRTVSGLTTLGMERCSVNARLRGSPSLRPGLVDHLPTSYLRAVGRAARETGLQTNQLPTWCPFTLEQVLDKDFLPVSFWWTLIVACTRAVRARILWTRD